MPETKYLMEKVERIEENMTRKLDTSHFEARMGAIDNLAAELKEYTKTVNELVMQGARREETDKHRDKEVERAINIGMQNQEAIQILIKQDAERKPYYKIIDRIIFVAVGLIVVGIAGAIAAASKMM